MADHWDYEAFWNEARERIRDTITRQEFDTWFANMTYHGSQQGIIELGVPSTFYRDQVAQRFQPALERALFELSALHLKLAYVIRGVSQAQPAAAAAPAAPVATVLVEAPRRHRQLNPDYTFDRLVEGESNTFALNAAVAIAKNPGRAYNPCLVYGGVGLGKTHLLQAIGNWVHASLPDLKVVYVTVETFTNEFIQSIKEKTGHRFKNRYRSADVLLIDDIQFLQGKVETQQELFHTFNALYDANKQMVFSSDRPVSELMNLPDRLINRFERGLNVDLQPPTYETRIAIVTRKIEERGLSLEHGIVELICRNIRSNVRDLEKALTKLAAYTELMQRTITPPIAQRELQEFFAKPEHLSITIDGIQRAVADYFSLTPADLKGKKRTKAIAFPRQVAMYVSRSLTNFSTTEVGLEFGGRDHTTVMHACQRITDRLKTDATLEPTLQRIINTLRQKSVA
ncbi:MAG: chromosomal replication initiator protein DnaA [Spirochaetaceae bacterium]|nr:chromosomal replication initiator protein DnaA [Spirochaetaceae bacterium]